jgi:hypothetical protein
MAEETGKYLCIAALTTAGALAAWTAWACRRARHHGLPGSDAIVWAAMALVYLLLAQTKLARVLGWLRSLGAWLRALARHQHVYANRRPYQIALTLTVAVIVAVLLAIGLVAMWNYAKRYRLAIGFTGLAVGFSVIRFISLHEVDAWNAAMPWVRVVIELTAAVGASAVAMVRLWQLRSSGTCGDRHILPVGPSDQHCS